MSGDGYEYVAGIGIHKNATELQACPECLTDPCIWRNDRCQHWSYIDDPGNTYDPDTRRWTCWVREERAA